MEIKHNYFIIFDTTEGAYVCLDTNNNLLTYSTETSARSSWESGYKEYH